MIYTKLTKKAMRISFEAHKDQVDKTGIPYIYHPFHVAEQMDDEITTCVALLHDVVEDSDVTLDDLIEQGFPQEVIDAVALLTHEDSVPYMEYVKRIKSNPVATKVKIADLEHNSDLTRLDHVDSAALERADKYRKAIITLRFPEKRNETATKILAWHLSCCDIDVPFYYRYCTVCGKEIVGAEESTTEISSEDTISYCDNCFRIIRCIDRYCGHCGAQSGFWRG